jgi:SAM-dependent methyltransferase
MMSHAAMAIGTLVITTGIISAARPAASRTALTGSPGGAGGASSRWMRAVFAEILRVLRPGGRLQFADIANGRPVPLEAMRDIDLWTG